MKYLLLLLLMTSLHAELITFSPTEVISASDFNHNFNEIKQAMVENDYPEIPMFSNISQGEVITKALLNSNFNNLGVINSFEMFQNVIISDTISAVEVNNTFESALLKAEEAYLNYYGDGSDGDVTISVDTELTVLNKNGSFDGDMVVKNFDNLTINAKLTTDQPGRGLLIYVKGNLNIGSTGIISMEARGANVDPTIAGVAGGGLQFFRYKSGGLLETSIVDSIAGSGSESTASENNQQPIHRNGVVYTVERVGSGGGDTAYCSNSGAGFSSHGNHGQSNINQTGGGGGGSCTTWIATTQGGRGGIGSCFSGGSGGGGSYAYGGYSHSNGAPGSDYGGAGGNSGVGTRSSYGSGGGTGNPKGTSSKGIPTVNGTGGLLVIIVKGEVNISSGGKISSAGSHSYHMWDAAGGGASGGGAVLLLHEGTLDNQGLITAAGGISVYNPPNNGYAGIGGNGGDGFVVIDKVGN